MAGRKRWLNREVAGVSRSPFSKPDPRREAARLQREAARELAYERGETSAVRTPFEGLSTDKIVGATIDKIRELAPDLEGDFLDVGAGNGELIDRIIREFRVAARACDYRDDLMTIGGLQVDAVNLNTEPLPYADASFDLVTCTEVIEHLEHYRWTLREVSRVLRPKGVFVVSTPNVLNLRSRLRYLFFGFFNLFGMIRGEDERHHSTHGHINPVSYFYLAHALHGAGFEQISVSVDKLQRRSSFALALLWLPIRAFSEFSIAKERRKYDNVDQWNEPFARDMNRIDLLLGRTLIVGCRKKAA